MSYPFQRIQNLARKLGISFREAAQLCGRKGARRRQERQCACLAEAQPKRVLWYQRENA